MLLMMHRLMMQLLLQLLLLLMLMLMELVFRVEIRLLVLDQLRSRLVISIQFMMMQWCRMSLMLMLNLICGNLGQMGDRVQCRRLKLMLMLKLCRNGISRRVLLLVLRLQD